MCKYGESKTTRIMMATVPHAISGLGLRKFQADGFLLTRVYMSDIAVFHFRLISWPFCHLTFTPTNPDHQHRSSTTPHAQNNSTSNAEDFLPYHCYGYSACAFQWRTQEFCSWEGSTNSVEDRGQTERGSGGGSPLVRGSGGSCNVVCTRNFIAYSKMFLIFGTLDYL